MNLFLMAFKTFRRKRIRSALTVGGVAIAVAVLVTLLGFDAGYQQALERDIDRMGYQVLVTAKGCPYEAATLMLKGGGGLRYMEQEVHDRIIEDERIEQISPQLVTTSFGSGENGTSVSMFVGITEAHLSLKPWVTFASGGWFTDESADEAIMGYEAAELEQRRVGDSIYVEGIDRVFEVVGIFDRTGTQDDGVIFLPLGTAQEAFGLNGRISGIGIKLKDIGQLASFEEDLYNEPGIQVVSMAQVRGTILNLMSSARTLTSSIAAIAIIVAVIGVMNTILMSVFERTRQIGVMKAMGASRFDIFRLVWIETTLVCAVGGVAGVLIAILAGRVGEQLFRLILPYSPGGRLVVVSGALLSASMLGAVAVGIIAGLYPAARAASMRPVEAIRSAE